MADWRRTFWAVWIANLITSIGMMSFLPFFPSLIEELGVSDPEAVSTWSGIIFGAAPLSATLMSPIWGSLGDRFGRKLMVVRSMLAISVFVGGMTFATTPGQLLVLRLCQGLFSGFIPPSVTLVSLVVPEARQARAAADLGTSLPLGAMIGPVLGGLIAASFGHRSVFVFVGVAALLSALLVIVFAREDASARQSVTSSRSPSAALLGVVRDLASTWRHPGLRGAILLLFVLQFGLGGTNPVMELHVRDLVDSQTFGASFLGRVAAWLPRPSDSGQDAAGAIAATLTLATSLLFAGMALANLIAMPWWGRLGDRVGHDRALRWCALGGLLSLCIQGAAPGYSTLFVGRFLMGLTMAGAGPLVFGLAAKVVPAGRRGSAMGAVFSARTLAVSMGAACVGPLVNRAGIPGMMFAAAGLIGVALLVFGFQNSMRRGRTETSSL